MIFIGIYKFHKELYGFLQGSTRSMRIYFDFNREVEYHQVECILLDKLDIPSLSNLYIEP